MLTYHAVNIINNSYPENDHLALASDLETLTRLGWRIVPLNDVVQWHRGTRGDWASAKIVAFSCDDGSWFDYYDLDHPTCGMQVSFLNILRNFSGQAGGALSTPPHITSFVISSPDARGELDQKGLIGKGWWGDEWWADADASGLMDIACHSWDHVHPDLERVAQREQKKGDFTMVDTFEDCEVQVKQAGAYIAQKLGGRQPTLFAYPWGQASEYIRSEYLPRHQEKHQFRAAFTTQAKPVEKSDSVWSLPRFVFGRDWKSPEGLEALLASCS